MNHILICLLTLLFSLSGSAMGDYSDFGQSSNAAKVTVNGQPAQTDASNNYQAWVDVTPGPNTITVEAEDWSPNANTATKSWSVNVTGGTARTFTYDGNGNTLSDGIRTYQWDAQDRLVKITQGTDEYEFIYDGLDRRVAEKVNGTITRRWVWDGTEIAEQRAPDGTTIQRRFYQQGEQRLSGTDAGGYFYTRDHLGSTRELTDDTTAIRARYDYDPYGIREKLSGDLDCDFAFTGHFYHAPTSLHLALYRAYDGETGRWLSVDPAENAELLPEGPNLYAYTGNSPIAYIDPVGEQTFFRPRPGGGASGSFRGASGPAAAGLRLAAMRDFQRQLSQLEKRCSVKNKKSHLEADFKEGGGFDAAKREFDQLAKAGGDNRRTIVRSDGSKMEVIDLPYGGTCSLRPDSSTGPPTIEIVPPKGSTGKKIKIRFR